MAEVEKKYLVLTAVGPDRPGLVKEVSAAIYRAGANLEDSRMAVLAGEFALIVLIAGDEDALRNMRDEQAALEKNTGLTVSTTLTARPGPRQEPLRYQLEVTGEDQPGIVHQVSEALADNQVNIASLESRLPHAAFSGTPLFSLEAELEVPDAAAFERLQARLEAVCEEKNLSWVLERAPAS